VKLRVDAMLGAISETPKRIAAIIVITTYFAEIAVPFGLNIIERTPIIRKRFAILDSNRLTQVTAVKTWGIKNIEDAVTALADVADTVVNSAKVCLKVLLNSISGELNPKEYHEKVTTKRSNTVTVLSVSSSLGLILEIMKITVMMPK
jgi:hypothetical protein